MHNTVCLHTSVITIKEKYDKGSIRLSFRLEQMKSLKVLSRPVPHLSASFISSNYPLPSAPAGDALAVFLTGVLGSMVPIMLKVIIDHSCKVTNNNREAPTVEKRLAAIQQRLGSAGQGAGTVVERITAVGNRIAIVEGRV